MTLTETQPAAVALNNLSNNQLQSEYEKTIEFFEDSKSLKKDVVLKMRDILILLGTPRHKISEVITRDLKGEVNPSYIREVLGKEFTNPVFIRRLNRIQNIKLHQQVDI